MSENVEQIVEIRVDAIDPGDNDRTVFPQDELLELAFDIKKNGLHSPILVRPHEGRYQIIYGERRWRAHKLADLPTIKAIVRMMTDREASRVMLAENLHRSNLNPIDEAQAYADRMAMWSMTVQEVADEQGKNVDFVRRRLKLLDLHPDIKPLVATGTMAIGYANAMSGLDHNFQIFKALPFITQSEKPPTVYAVEVLCNRLKQEQDQATLWAAEEFDMFMTQPIEQHLEEWGIDEEQMQSREELRNSLRTAERKIARLQEENDQLMNKLDEQTGLIDMLVGDGEEEEMVH